MLLSAVSVLVVAQSSSEIPEGLMNNPVLFVYNNAKCPHHIWQEFPVHRLRTAGLGTQF